MNRALLAGDANQVLLRLRRDTIQHRGLMEPAMGLICRIRGEYLEMPGLRLTLELAIRLWGLDRDTCDRILRVLVGNGFLSQDHNGRFVRTHASY